MAPVKQTDNFYTKEEVLLRLPKGRDEIRVQVGHKMLRGEAKRYLDIRAWYPDEAGIYRPGKGFAKPLTEEEMLRVAEAIRAYIQEGRVIETITEG